MDCEQLYQIYEQFTEQIVNLGWKGKILGWTETIRSEVSVGTWYLFELDNGFAIEFIDPIEGSEGVPFLQYWPEGSNEEEEGITVESLEQLLQLLN